MSSFTPPVFDPKVSVGIAFALLACIAACDDSAKLSGSGDGSTAGSSEASAPEVPRLARLTDLLEAAQAVSPLLELSDTAAPGDRTLLRQSFSDRGRALRWRLRGRCKTIVRESGNLALALHPSCAAGYAVAVGVEPGRSYRVEHLRRGSAALELVALEMKPKMRSRRLGDPKDLAKVWSRSTQAGSHAKLNALVRQHRFGGGEADRDGDWAKSALTFQAGRETHSLLLLFSPGAEPPSVVAFDDIVVERLADTAEQRLATIRKRYGMSTEGGPQGLAAFGQFLELTDGKEPGGAWEQTYQYRHGIIAPASTVVTWKLSIPKGALLTVGLGLMRDSPANARGRVTIRMGDIELLSAKLGKAARKAWRDEELDLSAMAGTEQSLEIQFEAVGDGSPIAVISNPILWRRRQEVDPPDVFVIAIDTLRADYLQTYGFEGPSSPMIAALANESIVFEQAIAPSNWTPESFGSILTATYGGQHGVTRRLSRLPRNVLAGELSDAGYWAEGIVYKLLLYDMGFERGFDDWFNVPRFHLSEGFDVHGAMNFARAGQWLERGHSRNQFLFVHFNDPHQPFNHRGESVQRFVTPERLAEHGLELPILIHNKRVTHGPKGRRCKDCVKGTSYAPWFVQLTRDLYAGEVAYVDDYVGRLIGELRARDLFDRSLIVLFSDHGEMLAEKSDYIGHGFSYMQEELVHVPLIIKPPASASMSPRRIAEQVRLIDLTPTILELVGIEPPEGLAGRSMVPVMRGDGKPPPTAICENTGAQTVAVREAGWKYVVQAKGKIRESLYDLRADPKERTDLSRDRQHLKRLGQLRGRAVDHILFSRSGSFLAVRRCGSGDNKLRLESVQGRTRVDGRVGSIKGAPDGTRWKLDGDGPWLVRVAPEAGAWRLKSSQGTLEVSAPSQWGASIVSGTCKAGVMTRTVNRAPATKRDAASVSAEEMEALEALGYVGGP